MTLGRTRAVAPALAASLLLAVAPMAMVFNLPAWTSVVLLAAWAGSCFKRGRFADGAILSVALTVVAAYAVIVGMLLMPFPALLPIVIFTWWRNPPAPPLPWLRRGLFGWSGALAAVVVAVAGGALAWGAVAAIMSHGGVWASGWLGNLSERPWVPPGASALDLAWSAMVAGIVGGGTEEALFRGALQERLTHALGAWPGVALQAVVYAAYCWWGATGLHLHGGLRLGAGAAVGLVLGFLLGVLRRLAQGLFAPSIAHALANVAIVFVVNGSAR